VLYRAGVDPLTDYGLWSTLWRAIKGVNGWLVVVAILGLARQEPATQGTHHMTHPASLRRGPMWVERVAEYVGEAQLPFYVLHMTPIVIVGSYVVQWEIGAFLKYLVISLVSFAATLLVYDIGVRRTGLTRLLFGMKLRGRTLFTGKEG
jgi:hypothetical protein